MLIGFSIFTIIFIIHTFILTANFLIIIFYHKHHQYWCKIIIITYICNDVYHIYDRILPYLYSNETYS